MMAATERQLAGLASALLVDFEGVTPAERALLEEAEVPTPDRVAAVRKAILAGDDPLGSIFCALRDPKERREQGAIYTPAAIIRSMIAWAMKQRPEPVRVVDPGAGSGRFSIAAAQAFPKARIVAVETDPLAALLLRANAAVLGFTARLTLELSDYRHLELAEVDGPTLFIGNPPYVRHHHISEAWKDWFGRTAAEMGFKASKLAGLHIHFFLKTRQLARPGDYGTFITAAEWLDVNYGKVLRDMLGDGLGGASLHVIDPAAQPFPDAMATGAIACFTAGNKPPALRMRSVSSLDVLFDLSEGSEVAWRDLAQSRRWSVYLRKERPTVHGIELGELFRVQRGQVTGANAIWIAGAVAEETVPARFLRPTVTKGRELLRAGERLDDPSALRRVVDLPNDLSVLDATERRSVNRFLKWAKALGADKGFIATHRKAWWSVGLKPPAPILVTYMARQAPAFVLNACGAFHINVAHGLYPREPMDDETLLLVLRFLRGSVSAHSGRTYAGGLTKFEPGEVERLTLPRLDELREMAGA